MLKVIYYSSKRKIFWVKCKTADTACSALYRQIKATGGAAQLMWAGPPYPARHMLPVSHECVVARLTSPPGRQSCNSSYYVFSGFNKDLSKLNKTTKTYVNNKPVCLAYTTWINDVNFQIYTLKYSNLLGI